MHQEEICIIEYKRILQRLRGLNRIDRNIGYQNYLFYGKFRKDLKLFIMQNLYIEIFIVETYYLIYQIYIKLTQTTNSTSNNEIYGVIPYIAPEIFKGFKFSKKSVIYCMGLIMWELTTGCKPFANVEHD